MSNEEETASPTEAGKSVAHQTFKIELDEEEHPRQFLKLSSQVFVYGGDSGELLRIDPQENSSKLVRQWESDALRVVAVSPDQKHVLVGLECGQTQLYTYQDFDHDSSSRGDQTHPFVTIPQDDSPDPSDTLLSQSDTLSSPLEGENMKPGHCFDTPVRDAVFLDNQYVVMASESYTIVWDVSQDSETFYLKKQTQQAHELVGCRSLVKIAERVFGSLGLDGRMAYWDCTCTDPSDWKLLHRESSLCVTVVDKGEFLSASAWDRACRPVMGGKEWLALPGASFWQWRNVRSSSSSLSSPQELKIEEYAHEQVSGSHTAQMVAAIPLGEGQRYWVSIGGQRDGRVILWVNDSTDKPDMKVVEILAENLKSAPTNACFCEATEKLLVSTADGTILTWNNVFETLAIEKQKPAAVQDSTLDETTETTTDPQVRQIGKRLSKQGGNNDEDDDDEDVDFTSDVAKPSSTFNMVDDQAAEEDFPTGGNDDDDDDNMSGAPKRALVDMTDNHSMGSEDDLDLPMVRPMMPMQTLKLPESQPAFAPSATPLDLSRRFLCWNHIGTITSWQGGDGRNTCTIGFHDSGFRDRPQINFTDTMGFIVGCLGNEGGIFASDLADDDNDDEDLGDVVDGLQMSDQTKAALKRNRFGKAGSKATGSTVYFHRFSTFGLVRDKDWYITLPSGERVLGCACGDAWAAVVTSRRFLRLFTSGGNQDQILWLNGDPVTVVGRAQFLAVFYHEAAPLMDGTQKLGYLLYDALANRVLGKGSLSCISPKSSLTWAGFSAENTLMAMDSDGMLSMLIAGEPGAGWEWMPVLDTQEHCKRQGDSIWPISVAGGKLNCVPLKGGIKYPSAARRPVTSNIGFRLPFARGPMQQTNALEELSVRAAVALQQKKVVHHLEVDGDVDEEFETKYEQLSMEVDKVTLRLFAATIEAGKVEKALDLVERLHAEKSFDIAMTLAENHEGLVNRIENIKMRRFGDDSEDEHDSNPDAAETTAQNSPYHVSPDTVNGSRSKRRFEDEEAGRSIRRREFA